MLFAFSFAKCFGCISFCNFVGLTGGKMIQDDRRDVMQKMATAPIAAVLLRIVFCQHFIRRCYAMLRLDDSIGSR